MSDDDNDMPWWAPTLLTIASSLVLLVATKIVDKILADKKMTHEEKLSKLDDALSNAKISKKEWQKARDSIMTNYASHA